MSSEDKNLQSRNKRLEEAAEEAHLAIDEMMELKKKSAGPCHECRFYEYLHPITGSLCISPIVAKPTFHPHSGTTTQTRVTPESARSTEGLCGPEGLLFRQKVVATPWSDHTPVPQPTGRRYNLLLFFSAGFFLTGLGIYLA